MANPDGPNNADHLDRLVAENGGFFQSGNITMRTTDLGLANLAESSSGGEDDNATRAVARMMQLQRATDSVANSGETIWRTLTSVADLQAMMNHGPHVNGPEGILARFNLMPPGSAILFEATRVDSTSTTVELRYLPLAIKARDNLQAPGVPGPSTALSNVQQPLEVLPRTQNYINRARLAQASTPDAGQTSQSHNTSDNGSMSTRLGTPPSSPAWPSEVPVEIFNMFAQNLSSRDIRSMRLVCKEFEQKISPTLFEEVVVPFTSELYDMVEDDASTRRTLRLTSPSLSKGKGRATDMPAPFSSSQDPPDNSMYYRASGDGQPKHGLRVFQGFGPHMKKFGIRFDVTEAELSAPPPKKSSDKHVEAYHGNYKWPPSGYSRFGRLAKLEAMADETPRMTAALASLKNVREIGLSINSGLGYLAGADRSSHAMVMEKPAPLFEGSSSDAHLQDSGANEFWASLQESHSSFNAGSSTLGNMRQPPLDEEQLVSFLVPTGAADLSTICPSGYEDTNLWPSLQTKSIPGVQVPLPAIGVIYFRPDTPNLNTHRAPLVPTSLSTDQTQWLLETGWAQHAFMDSYVLALADNPHIFHQVTKVTILQISSGLLMKLDNDSFWNSLPHVEEITLLVSPDWRTVGKDDIGCAQTRDQSPALAVIVFYEVLKRLKFMDSIRKLTIGYTSSSGGENARGVYARNANLMPAPLTDIDDVFRPFPLPLCFTHVEHLVLKNCWLTPATLTHLAKIRQIAGNVSRALTLDSVSLTANPKGVPIDHTADPQTDPTHTNPSGSWPSLLKKLKLYFPPPGTDPDIDNAPSPPTTVHAQTTTLISCGYAVFPNPSNSIEDQSGISPIPVRSHNSPDQYYTSTSEWHRSRAALLMSYVMRSQDVHLARCTAWVGARERMILEGMGMEFGPWGAEGEVAGDGAIFDGAPRKGTGRFGGVIQ
ncbi:hypothetical protein Q7P37_010399 [Cladosporium fusiforme]